MNIGFDVAGDSDESRASLSPRAEALLKSSVQDLDQLIIGYISGYRDGRKGEATYPYRSGTDSAQGYKDGFADAKEGQSPAFTELDLQPDLYDEGYAEDGDPALIYGGSKTAAISHDTNIEAVMKTAADESFPEDLDPDEFDDYLETLDQQEQNFGGEPRRPESAKTAVSGSLLQEAIDEIESTLEVEGRTYDLAPRHPMDIIGEVAELYRIPLATLEAAWDEWENHGLAPSASKTAYSYPDGVGDPYSLRDRVSDSNAMPFLFPSGYNPNPPEVPDAMKNVARREAHILEAMRRAGSLDEQRKLLAELNDVRATRTARVKDDRALDLANATIADRLTPVFPHEPHTASTEWLGGVDVEASDDTETSREMTAQASVWVKNLHEAVIADEEEFTEQARGKARQLTSSLGEARPAAVQAFLDASAHLRSRLAATNEFGQELRDGWEGNPSNYDDDIGDLEGYELQMLREEREGSRRQAAQRWVVEGDGWFEGFDSKDEAEAEANRQRAKGKSAEVVGPIDTATGSKTSSRRTATKATQALDRLERKRDPSILYEVLGQMDEYVDDLQTPESRDRANRAHDLIADVVAFVGDPEFDDLLQDRIDAARSVLSRTSSRTAATMVNDADHAVLDAEFNDAFAELRAAGLEADADHPIAERYRAASDAVNHANRSRDFAIMTGQPTASRRTAGDAKTCAECGDPIKKNPDEGRDGYIHDSGTKHDHKAKAGKESAKAKGGTCSVCGEAMEQEGDGSWSHNVGNDEKDHEAKAASRRKTAEVTVERVHPSGALSLSTFVNDGSGEWLHTKQFYDYTEAEARELFLENIADQGWTVTSSKKTAVSRRCAVRRVQAANGQTCKFCSKAAEWEVAENGGQAEFFCTSHAKTLVGGLLEVNNGPDAISTKRLAGRRISVALTNVGVDPDTGNGVGTDPSGQRVQFRMTEKEKADLKTVLLSDMAVNFSGVDVEQSDIIREGSRRRQAASLPTNVGDWNDADWDMYEMEQAANDPNIPTCSNCGVKTHDLLPSFKGGQVCLRCAKREDDEMRRNSSRKTAGDGYLAVVDIDGDPVVVAESYDLAELVRQVTDQGYTEGYVTNQDGGREDLSELAKRYSSKRTANGYDEVSGEIHWDGSTFVIGMVRGDNAHDAITGEFIPKGTEAYVRKPGPGESFDSTANDVIGRWTAKDIQRDPEGVYRQWKGGSRRQEAKMKTAYQRTAVPSDDLVDDVDIEDFEGHEDGPDPDSQSGYAETAGEGVEPTNDNEGNKPFGAEGWGVQGSRWDKVADNIYGTERDGFHLTAVKDGPDWKWVVGRGKRVAIRGGAARTLRDAQVAAEGWVIHRSAGEHEAPEASEEGTGVEVFEDEPGDGAANVASTPTPGGESGYPQPQNVDVHRPAEDWPIAGEESATTAAFRRRVQASVKAGRVPFVDAPARTRAGATKTASAEAEARSLCIRAQEAAEAAGGPGTEWHQKGTVGWAWVTIEAGTADAIYAALKKVAERATHPAGEEYGWNRLNLSRADGELRFTVHAGGQSLVANELGADAAVEVFRTAGLTAYRQSYMD